MKRVKFGLLSVLLAAFLWMSGCEKQQEVLVLEESEILRSEKESTALEKESALEERESAAKETDKVSEHIYVYVCGAVAHPGVVELPGNARVFEAIEKAGGLTEDAADFSVNQASLLEDGQQIVVLTKEEAETQTVTVTSTGESGAAEEEKVNINQAGSEELMRLPGIGAAKAADIIEYRETNGKFQDIEEIKNISGIKDAVFQKIKDKIVV